MLHSLKPQGSKAKVVIRYFGINGQQKTDGPHTLAKAVLEAGKRGRYFCKYNTHGVEAGHLVNPWSMYAIDTANFTNAVNPRTGKELHEYREVSETVFLLYARYLESRSDVHYRQAERLSLENG
jgi:lysophospholipase L1-like esterase